MAQSTCGSKEKLCWQLKINGTVQGVGFRPFIYNLANDCNLGGWINNSSAGVMIEVEGTYENLVFFQQQLQNNPPQLANIESVELKPIPSRGYKFFSIAPSKTENLKTALIPADAAVCNECLEEILNPLDRHYLYPFTNCTQCGPRFTIIKDIPYDRVNTTMSSFALCPDCSEDYGDITNRRFHAQPVACPACGPKMEIIDRKGINVTGPENWLSFAWKQLLAGKILAVKGIGGFHLACIADQHVVELLRTRKKRSGKPFAVMCRDLEAVNKYCHLNETEKQTLSSSSAPIVLLKLKGTPCLPQSINPGLSTLGVMLPYSPLHFLLLQGPLELMVLTSANPTDLPILKDNHEALEYLHGIADYFVIHNREINQRCDDSVAFCYNDKPLLVRRSRGFVPNPIILGFNAREIVLGIGGDMKNTFCLINKNQAILSQHLGEINTVEAEDHYLESLNHMIKFYDLKPKILGYDLHPIYNASRLAKNLPAEYKYAVQHHHGHLASCLTDNHYHDKALGIILDGTGYGPDEAIWGFEILHGDLLDYQREYHQRYTPLLGGEYSINNPWVMALSYLLEYYSNREGTEIVQELFAKDFPEELDLVLKTASKSRNHVKTSSCGRLFDAVSALLGICHVNTYEGQAAIELGELVIDQLDNKAPDPYPFMISQSEIDFLTIFPAILEDLKKNKDLALIAKRFHDTVIKAVTSATLITAERRGLKTIALSGGSWNNPYLLTKTVNILQAHGMDILLPKNIPFNDGGLCLGQAAIAYRRWKENVPGCSDENS